MDLKSAIKEVRIGSVETEALKFILEFCDSVLKCEGMPQDFTGMEKSRYGELINLAWVKCRKETNAEWTAYLANRVDMEGIEKVIWAEQIKGGIGFNETKDATRLAAAIVKEIRGEGK